MSRRLPVLLVAPLLALAACRGEPSALPDAGRPVTLSPVIAVDLEERIEASGELLAKEQAEIAAEIGGRITELLIDEGQPAEAGATVLRIDPERRTLERDSAQARLEEAVAALREQEREAARVKELRARGVASATQLDQAETALKLARSRRLAAEAQLGVAERALRDANVAAPFAGLIANRYVSRGEYVAAGEKLFELVSLDPIEVEFFLPEVDSGRVRIDHPVELRVAPHPDESFRATVTLIAPTIDTRTRTLRVKAELANPEGRLRPGLFARVDLGIATRRGVPMIPEEAVLQRADGAVVFRLQGDSRVERRLVETGTYRDGAVEVVAGIEVGDLVVSRGHSALSDGERVVPRDPDGNPVAPPLPDVAGAREDVP